MLKLPICPYCGKKTQYKSSFSAMGEKEFRCRRCGKISKVRYKAACAKLALWVVLVLIAINTAMLFAGNMKTLLPNLIMTVCVITGYLFLTPLKVTLFEIEGQRDPEPKRKKNRHRHKKTKLVSPSFEENPLEGTSFDE